MADTTQRACIEEWLSSSDGSGLPIQLSTLLAVVRAALVIIDAEHPPGGCNSTCAEPGMPWICPRKAAHEARLWEAIRG